MPYDNTIEEAIKGLNRGYVQDNNLDTLPAVTGDKDGNLIVPFLPDHWWVRIQTSNGLSQKIHVRAPTGKVIPAKAGVNVQLERDKKGRLRICEPDTDNTNASGGTVTNLQTQTLTPRITQSNVETLSIVPTIPPSLYVILKSWYILVNGLLYFFPGIGGGVNLTASVPAAGNMCYVVIFVKSDYLTVEVTASTARSIADVPLDLADIQECLDARSAGSTPTYALKLIGGQTTITQADIEDPSTKDLRQLVNTAGSAPQISSANVTDPPTATELNSAFGTAAAVGAGFIGLINDNGDSLKYWLCMSDGTDWLYSAMTKAV